MKIKDSDTKLDVDSYYRVSENNNGIILIASYNGRCEIPDNLSYVILNEEAQRKLLEILRLREDEGLI